MAPIYLRNTLLGSWQTRFYPLISTNPREWSDDSRRLARIGGHRFNFAKAIIGAYFLVANLENLFYNPSKVRQVAYNMNLPHR